MLEQVKLALRITHNLLDSEIVETIETARAEMLRSGVSSDCVNDDTNALVRMAIKTFCLMHFSNNEKMAEGYERSFNYQVDCLRKSEPYV